MVVDIATEAAIALIEVIWNTTYLRWGAILLLIAIALEVINGLIEIAVYTLIVGAALLFGVGSYLIIF